MPFALPRDAAMVPPDLAETLPCCPVLSAAGTR